MSKLGLFYRPHGYSLDFYVNQIKSELELNEEAVEVRLREHLSWCVNQVPMYRGYEVRGANSFDCLKSFPVFNKKKYRLPVAETRSLARFKGERIDGTSGTSGLSFQFITTANERAVRKAYEIVANALLGFGANDRHVVVWGGHESSSLLPKIKTRLFDLFSSRELIVVSGADRVSLQGAREAVVRNSGNVLVTYPSMFRGLADELELNDVLETYKSVILTGEAIPEEYFDSYKRCQLGNRYGSREFGAIAVGKGMNLGYFRSRFVLESDPELGLLVTDLEKRCMPMLRYPIGDFLRDPLPSSFSDQTIQVGAYVLPRMGPVAGRVFDVLQGKSGKKYLGTFWTIYLKKIGVEKFRLLEIAPSAVRLRYVGQKSESEILDLLEPRLKADFNWSAEKVLEIPELSNSKQKIVERLYV